MGFKYAVNCDTLGFLGHDLLDDPQAVLEAIKSSGYDGADLPGNPERVDVSALRQTVEALGLDVPEVSGAWAWGYHGPEEPRKLAGPDEGARERGVAASKQLIDLAVQLGARFFPVCAVQSAIPEVPFPKHAQNTLRESFVRSLQELCPYAAERGITLVIEPLNRYEAYAGVATTVDETASLIEELGFENLGIQPDVFHMNMAEQSVCAALRTAGKHIKHMHINETNHFSLGTGHADFTAVIRTLKDVNYAGYLSVYMPFTTQEVWQETAPRVDLSACLESALAYLKEIEHAVDRQRFMYNLEATYLTSD